MTSKAIHPRVATGQREVRCVVIERGVAPSRFIMAQRAIGWELRRCVVRVRGSVVFRHMAGIAIGWRALEIGRAHV